MSLTLRTTGPVGVTLVASFYVAKVVFYLERTLVRLDHRFYRLILNGAGIRDLVIALFSLFVVIGLMRMQSWGRILAIIVSGTLAAWGGWISSVRYNDGPLDTSSRYLLGYHSGCHNSGFRDMRSLVFIAHRNARDISGCAVPAECER